MRNGTYFTSFKHHITFFSSCLVCASLGLKFLNVNCFGKYALGDLYDDKDNFDDDNDYVSGNMQTWIFLACDDDDEMYDDDDDEMYDDDDDV